MSSEVVIDLSTHAGRHKHSLPENSIQYVYACRDKELLITTPLTKDMILGTLDAM